MSDATEMTMHPDFPRWYREVSVEDNREKVHARWSGVVGMIGILDKTKVECLLKIVFQGGGAIPPDVGTNIRSVFKSADDLFDMQGNDREVEVLAGCVLAVLLEQDSNLAGWSALAITTTSLDGTRSAKLPFDLVAGAENTIARMAERNRKRPNLLETKLQLPAISSTNPEDRFQGAIDANNINNFLDRTTKRIESALGIVVGKLNEAIEGIDEFILLQDEELDMLWWVLGERSHSMKKSFKAVAQPARPLVFGSELAEATVYIPGPLSIEGLLARAGLKKTEKLTIPEAINHADETWLQALVASNGFSALTQPIHFGIQRKLETKDEAAWVSGWAAGCGIDAKVALPALTLANLFYRERLLSIF